VTSSSTSPTGHTYLGVPRLGQNGKILIEFRFPRSAALREVSGTHRGFDGDIPGYTTSLYHNYDQQATIIVEVNSDIPLPGTTPPALPAPAVFDALVKALQ